jgi:hypothetical protein
VHVVLLSVLAAAPGYTFLFLFAAFASFVYVFPRPSYVRSTLPATCSPMYQVFCDSVYTPFLLTGTLALLEGIEIVYSDGICVYLTCKNL